MGGEGSAPGTSTRQGSQTVEGLALAAKGLSLDGGQEAGGMPRALPPPMEPLVLQPITPVYNMQAAKQILDACYLWVLGDARAQFEVSIHSGQYIWPSAPT